MAVSDIRGVATAVLVLLGALAPAAPVVAGPRLVLISVDGLRPDAIRPLETPRMAGLRDGGAWTATALNDLPSATLPNHTTMLTGVVSDVHGVIFNFDTPGLVPLETLFDYAAAAGLRCEFFASKSKLDFLAPPGSVQWMDIDGDTTALTERFCAQIHAAGPDVLFLHLRDPDSVGHVAGWMSAAYHQAVSAVDALVGQILDAVAADGSRPTYIMLTADHGGDATNHFLNIPENRQVPWMVSGPDIPAGWQITDAVTTADTTPTALWLLGVAAPSKFSGRALTSVRDRGAVPGGAAAVAPVGLPCVLLSAPLGFSVLLLVGRAAGALARRG